MTYRQFWNLPEKDAKTLGPNELTYDEYWRVRRQIEARNGGWL
jgi:hypothetical protein